MNKLLSQGILITDGPYIIEKADTCTSVDIHLRQFNQYCQVILPTNHCIVIEPDGTITLYDHTDTHIGELNIIEEFQQC